MHDGYVSYVRSTDHDTVIVGVYVDGLLVTGTKESLVDELFEDRKVLDIKNLGKVSKFLGMRVSFDESTGYTLDQEVMIDGILEDFELKDANPVKVPITQEYEDINLGESEVLPKDGKVSIKSFQSLVGSLLWIYRCTRPDISFAVHKTTRRTHAPKQVDWNLAKRIARYLKGSKHMKLHMGISNNVDSTATIKAYSDSDYAGLKDDRKSTTGGVVPMDDMVLNWICKKQGGVSLSTMEAKFYAASKIEVEMLGFRELIQEVGLKVERPMVLLIDN